MRCTLIYNPASGQHRERRAEQMRRITDALSDLGHAVDLVATTAPGSASAQAREAAAQGAEIIFACGGDGTVHEVLQGLVSEPGDARVSLGIVPTGSANALARHLGLSLDPLTAALQQVGSEAVRVPVGKLRHKDGCRYFAVMAGTGPDGALTYEVLAEHKSRLGRLAYYVHAARIFMTRRFHPYRIHYREAGSDYVKTQKAVSMLAVRVGDLGGLFSGLASRDTSVHDATLCLLVLSPPAIVSLPLWFLFGWFNLHRFNPYLKCADVSEASSHSDGEAEPHVQVDGEWLGRGSISLSVVPHALLLRIPLRNSSPGKEESNRRAD